MTSSEPAGHRRRRRWPRVIAAVAGGAVLLASAAGVVVLATAVKLEGNIEALDITRQVGTDRPVKSVQDPRAPYQAMNILLMGSDTREGQGRRYGDPNVYDTARSDTTILLHLSADRTRALAVSIPRDSWVELPECKRPDGSTAGVRKGRFNEAFERGGPGCTVKAVESLTGVFVDHFAVVNFIGFTRLVDAIGGVEVCLKEPVKDKDSQLELPAGRQTIAGQQALGFVRARKTLGDGSDISRIERQQEFISSFVRKATSLGVIANPVSLYRMLDAATSSLTTDPELASLTAMRELAQSVQDLKPSALTFATVPWRDRGDGATVEWNETRADELWAAIKADRPWPTPPTPGFDGKPLVTAPSKIDVTVLNGSGVAGRATAAAEQLRAAGFNVVDVGSAARSTYRTSVVVSDPKYDQSARTLRTAVKGSSGSTVAGQGSTLTLVVGRDFAGVTPVVVRSTSSQTTPPRTADQSVCVG